MWTATRYRAVFISTRSLMRCSPTTPVPRTRRGSRASTVSPRQHTNLERNRTDDARYDLDVPGTCPGRASQHT